jgi:ABC-type antimicrobial peptide transport system permease subunit
VDIEHDYKFRDEERIGQLSAYFSALAIFISCLGLFGMASFMAEQRQKEIGVRKVLGASVFTLCYLLIRDFVKLVLIALLIAGPVAFILMNKWLVNYDYRTTIPWWIFVWVGAGALIITILTVGQQTVTAALQNPVKSIRTP